MTQQEFHEITQGTLTPEKVSMTLAEFLEYDIEGYEYVKGKLVPMPVVYSINLIGVKLHIKKRNKKHFGRKN